MIQELADYEEASSSVLATESSLLETLCFAPDPHSPPSGPGYAKTLVLRLPPTSPSTPDHSKESAYHTPQGQVIGMALYFNNYSTWRSAPGIYLEDLYVRKAFRGSGYGTLLIKALAKEVVRIGGKRLEWTCLRSNTPSLEFYRLLGAKEMHDWIGLRVDGDVLMRLAGEADKEATVKGV